MEFRYDGNVEKDFDSLSESTYLRRIFDFLDLPSGTVLTVKSSNYSDKPIYTAPILTKRNVLIYLSEDYNKIEDKLTAGFDLVFKCYADNTSEYHPFPLGYEGATAPYFQDFPWERRPIDLFFAGNLNSNRIDLYKELFGLRFFSSKLLDRLQRSRFRSILPRKRTAGGDFLLFSDGFKKGLTSKEYINLMCQSKVVICPKGFHSAETFRHYEAMRAGCILISEELPNTWMYHGSPIIQVNNFNKLRKKIKNLLSREEEAFHMHQAMKKWWDEQLDPKMVAKRISALVNS